MKQKFSQMAGSHMADVHVASSRAGLFVWIVGIGWIVFPFCLQTVMWPSDMLLAQYKIQGVPIPHSFTFQQLFVGFADAVFALCVLALVQMVCTVLFYRKAQIEGASVATPTLWVLAAFVGLLGNAIWFFGTSAFDFGGCLVGFSSVALTVGCERLCNKLGREFVHGPAQSAQPANVLYQFPGNGA